MVKLFLIEFKDWFTARRLFAMSLAPSIVLAFYILADFGIVLGTQAPLMIAVVWGSLMGGPIVGIYSLIFYSTSSYLNLCSEGMTSACFLRVGTLTSTAIVILIIIKYYYSILVEYYNLKKASTNGNFDKLQNALFLVRMLQRNWSELPKREIELVLESVNDYLGNSLALLSGWSALFKQEQDYLLDKHSKNVSKDEGGNDKGYK